MIELGQALLIMAYAIAAALVGILLASGIVSLILRIYEEVSKWMSAL
jgi:hypothetical protein